LTPPPTAASGATTAANDDGAAIAAAPPNKELPNEAQPASSGEVGDLEAGKHELLLDDGRGAGTTVPPSPAPCKLFSTIEMLRLSKEITLIVLHVGWSPRCWQMGLQRWLWQKTQAAVLTTVKINA
jgi:hypothetical protein